MTSSRIDVYEGARKEGRREGRKRRIMFAGTCCTSSHFCADDAAAAKAA